MEPLVKQSSLKSMRFEDWNKMVVAVNGKVNIDNGGVAQTIISPLIINGNVVITGSVTIKGTLTIEGDLLVNGKRVLTA